MRDGCIETRAMSKQSSKMRRVGEARRSRGWRQGRYRNTVSLALAVAQGATRRLILEQPQEMRRLVTPAPRDPRGVMHVVATGTMAHRPFTLAQHALAPGLRAAAAIVNDKQAGRD